MVHVLFKEVIATLGVVSVATSNVKVSAAKQKTVTGGLRAVTLSGDMFHPSVVDIAAIFTDIPGAYP